MFVCWNLGTAIGAASGGVLGDPRRLGLDAMLPAAFLALLAPHLARPEARRIAVAGGLIALVMVPIAPAGLPIVAAGTAVLIPRMAPEPIGRPGVTGSRSARSRRSRSG